MANNKYDAKRFCRENYLFDAHSDIFRFVEREGYDILSRNDARHFDVPRAKEGGLDVMVMAACYNADRVGNEDPEEYVAGLIDLMGEAEGRSEGRFIKLTTKEKFDSFGPDDKMLGYIVGIEGGEPFKGDMKRWEKFYEKGMRILSLTHDANNEISQGVAEAVGPFFITGFGWEVIAACEEKGVLVDIAHLHEENVKYILDFCTKPFTVSHTACRTLCDHRRAILDDHLFELGRLGCVVGIDLIQKHLKSGPDYMEATIEDFFDHVEHAVEVAGIDTVGLGTDMDIYYPLPDGFEDATSYPAIVEGLHHRGWSNGDIAKLMGGNFRRLLSRTLPSVAN